MSHLFTYIVGVIFWRYKLWLRLNFNLGLWIWHLDPTYFDIKGTIHWIAIVKASLFVLLNTQKNISFVHIRSSFFLSIKFKISILKCFIELLSHKNNFGNKIKFLKKWRHKFKFKPSCCILSCWLFRLHHLKESLWKNTIVLDQLQGFCWPIKRRL